MSIISSNVNSTGSIMDTSAGVLVVRDIRLKTKKFKRNAGSFHTRELYQKRAPTFLHCGLTFSTFPVETVPQDVVYIPTADAIVHFHGPLSKLSGSDGIYLLYLDISLISALEASSRSQQRCIRDHILDQSNNHSLLYYTRLHSDGYIQSSSRVNHILSYLQMLIGLKRARVLLLTIGESDSIRKSDRKIPPESICDLQTAIARSNLHEQLPDIQQASANVTQVHYRFHPHLSEKDIIAGLKLSVLVQGELKVADFDTESAWISINSFDGKRETTVLIRNLCDRNRAMVGDTVVVRVNPKSMWHGNSSEMLIMQHERKDSEEEGNDNSETMDTAFVSFPGLSCTSASELVPTGVVVAITTRRNSEIIATFPQLSRENVVAHKAEEYVLVIPIDRKLPKIRVFTRQAQSLQGKRAVVNIDKTFFKI